VLAVELFLQAHRSRSKPSSLSISRKGTQKSGACPDASQYAEDVRSKVEIEAAERRGNSLNCILNHL
jgi:hypothetical protein